MPAGVNTRGDDYYLDSNLALEKDKPVVGCWFSPHNATINIKFFSYGRFEFNDYNSKTDEHELLTGKFELKDQTLTLMYDDRPGQRFAFISDSGIQEIHYIKNSAGYYFVKGLCQF